MVSYMNKLFSAKVGTALILSHERFLSLFSYPSFSDWFEMGQAYLDKEDITYFCEPTRVREHLNPNVMAVGSLFANVARSRLIKSDQTTPIQSWWSKITGFWVVEHIITLRLLISL